MSSEAVPNSSNSKFVMPASKMLSPMRTPRNTPPQDLAGLSKLTRRPIRPRRSANASADRPDPYTTQLSLFMFMKRFPCDGASCCSQFEIELGRLFEAKVALEPHQPIVWFTSKRGYTGVKYRKAVLLAILINRGC